MTTFRCENLKLKKKIKCPASKSHSNRHLILASLVPEDVILHNISRGLDVVALIDSLKQVGIQIEESGDDLIVKNSFPSCEVLSTSPVVIKTNDGGTTNRFLIPFLALGKNHYIIEPDEQILSRPMNDYQNILENLGVAFFDNVFSLKGPITNVPSEITVSGEHSTQFASALQLTLGLHNCNVELATKSSSYAYFQITKDILEDYKYGKREFHVPVDFSSISYPSVLGVLQNGISITNVDRIDTTQADSFLFALFDQLEIKYQIKKNILQIFPKHNPGAFHLNCSQFPDLVPTLAVFASHCHGRSVLSGLQVLKFKETDRINEICNLLTLFEVDFTYHASHYTLEIFGPAKKVGFKRYNSPKDHRLIMSSTLFMMLNSGGEITNSENVMKSYPDFFTIFESN